MFLWVFWRKKEGYGDFMMFFVGFSYYVAWLEKGLDCWYLNRVFVGML